MANGGAREKERQRARKGENPSAATESASSSILSGHFGSKVRQGTAPLYIEATRLLLLLLPLLMLPLLLLLLLLMPLLLVFLFRSFSPRRVASCGLTGEAGHLKYSSDAGLNEARPNVNLSTCFQLAMYPRMYPRILHTPVCACVCAHSGMRRACILDYSRHAHIHTYCTRTRLLPPLRLYWQLYGKMRSIQRRMQISRSRTCLTAASSDTHIVSALCLPRYYLRDNNRTSSVKDPSYCITHYK